MKLEQNVARAMVDSTNTLFLNFELPHYGQLARALQRCLPYLPEEDLTKPFGLDSTPKGEVRWLVKQLEERLGNF